MSLGRLEILNLFKTNMMQFIDNLVELFPEEAELIMFRIFFENQIPVEISIKKFSAAILPAKEMIRTRNEKFFYGENDVFKGIKEDRVIKWKHLWKNGKLDSSDKEAIWKWMHVFLGLAELFEDNERKYSKEN